jgi:hypothetical protein
LTTKAKTLTKLTFGIVALAAASWLLVFQTARFLHGNSSANRVWFYNESEKKLYAMPDTTIPPDKGNGDRAMVVELGGEQKIAYLLVYTPELKKTLDEVLQARVAGKVFDGKIPSSESEYFKTNTLVRSLDETNWYSSNTPQGSDIIHAWRSWRGPDGSAPRVCPAN